jgi:PAS domain S-box-containing protein
VRQLDQRYPALRQDERAPASAGMIDAPLEDLDLATVIKVSQAVSGEIVPEKLIESLLRTAIEHAGADRGLLILPRNGEFLIKAEAKTRGTAISVSLCETPVSAAELAESVVCYAARTHESVLLNDTSVGSLHASDEYIGAHGVRSVLCLPLMKQGALVALLYLENRLASGVFTPGRISVLKVIASQAAISLENSSLYRELREREAQIRRLIDANIVGIIFWNQGGQIVEANDAFLRMVGYEREDLVAGRLLWTDLTPREWLDRQQEQNSQQLRQTGSLPPYEKEYFHKDGRLVPVLIGVAAFDKDCERGVAYVVDMTERKRAEAELRRSRQYLAQAQKISHTGSWAWSPVSNTVLYWSDECYRVLGHDPAKGLPSFEQLVEDVHPDDRPRVLESWGKAVREGFDWEIEYRLRNFDTGVRTVRSVGHPILDRSGQPIEYIGTVIDVTEQKRAEDERREYLWFLECMDRINRAMQRTNEVESMTSGVLEETLAIFDCDRAWLMYPCDPDTPTCRAVMEHTHPDFPGAFALGEAFPVDAPAAEVLRDMLHASGAVVDPDIPSEIVERFNIRSTIAIAVRPKGDRPYLFGLHQCSHVRVWTTGERRLFEEIGRRLEDALTSALAHHNLVASEEALRHAREKLAQASRMATVAELSASIAHEINQPLQAVVSNGQACQRWLAATPPDIDNARLSAQAIVFDGYATADVINRIRALFKHTAPAKVDLDVNKLILQVCALMADEIHVNAILLETRLAQDVPMIKADAVQIQQVIVNLVRNAIEALVPTTERPKSLVIRSRRDGDNVVVDVQDHGPGLADLEKIFEPFATTKETGMGMGLAICRSIVESHAGRIWVVRNEVRGVTFSFSLPAGNGTALPGKRMDSDGLH